VAFTRRLLAGLLLSVVLAMPAAQALSQLHPSLQAMEAWLGEWHDETSAGAPTWVEYRAVLGGRFVELRRRDSPDGDLRVHSMIAAGSDDGALSEYRFDHHGRITVHPFSAEGGPTGRRVAEMREPQPATSLDASLDILKGFLGQWEVTTDWFDGGLLWAQMSNYAELDGRVICSHVLVKEEDKAPYDRYRTFYFSDAAGTLREITFTYRGLVVDESFTAETTADGVVLTGVYRPGSLASMGIRKELTITSERQMHWTDYFRNEGTQTWEKVIDAGWIRTGGPDPLLKTMAIDAALFAGSGAAPRSITVERLMSATPEQVWNAWTTESGWKTAYSADRPEGRANIELAPGGRYEWLFDGKLGCNGCQVLSYLPQRMLSFTWNAPVTQPQSRVKRTWVVVEIEPQPGGKSLVRATQLGFGVEPHWDETRDYFEKAWASVLDRIAASFE
jgi:uncharacterized protein YndB with AHSA1/START domain